MKKINELLILIGSTFAFSGISFASDFKYGVDLAQINSTGNNVEYKTTVIQFSVSKELNQALDILASLGLGIDDTSKFQDYGGYTLDYTAKVSNILGIFLNAHSAFDANWQIFAEIGYVKIEHDLSIARGAGLINYNYDDSSSVTDLSYSYGIYTKLSPVSLISIKYTRYPDLELDLFDLYTINSDSISIGYQTKF